MADESETRLRIARSFTGDTEVPRGMVVGVHMPTLRRALTMEVEAILRQVPRARRRGLNALALEVLRLGVLRGFVAGVQFANDDRRGRG